MERKFSSGNKIPDSISILILVEENSSACLFSHLVYKSILQFMIASGIDPYTLLQHQHFMLSRFILVLLCYKSIIYSFYLLYINMVTTKHFSVLRERILKREFKSEDLLGRDTNLLAVCYSCVYDIKVFFETFIGIHMVLYNQHFILFSLQSVVLTTVYCWYSNCSRPIQVEPKKKDVNRLIRPISCPKKVSSLAYKKKAGDKKGVNNGAL